MTALAGRQRAPNNPATLRFQRRFDAKAAADLVGTSGYAPESVPFALAIAVSARDLVTAILNAIACGGDTDTNASIVGHILGARGHRPPEDLLERIPCRDEIARVSQLVTSAVARRT